MKGNYQPLQRPEQGMGGVFSQQTPPPKETRDLVTLSLRVDRGLRARLKATAATAGRSMEDCVSEALESWLDQER
ncbi:MAG: ribbon-helix-helix domain-containing protein [Bifidobacterium crudilactis]|jgi:predicted HicB family RNase H-like nuclease|nr:ribbon-helix-helix domain-containing protein [Bifidobacterium crudilactis]MCI1889872.1 ribbon-helix-helix domain-containing protein [Bifidobacterium crudilactis]